MSAETLRRAASLMRERAEAARSFYSDSHPKARQEVPWFGQADLYDFDEDDGPHVIGMSPAVALAVVDLLENEANAMDRADGFARDYAHVQTTAYNEARRSLLLAVARAYLGSDA